MMDINRPESNSCSFLFRLRVALRLILDLRSHDFRAAATFMRKSFSKDIFPVRLYRFFLWSLRQVFIVIPEAMTTVDFDRKISRTPFWLITENPLANHPWSSQPEANLPDECEVVVIGAGFTGAGCAYFWSKHKAKPMTVLEMDDPASGASGRNGGEIVMGRYLAMVKKTVSPYLEKVRPDLSENERDQLSLKFASTYTKSAYKNGEMIENTIREEGIACDYQRKGWIQGCEIEDQTALMESVRLGCEAGFDDWTTISPEEAKRRGGMIVECPAGFSRGTATFHPAKWVWSLLDIALRSSHVNLYTRTRVTRVEDAGDFYLVNTNRGRIKAKYVINATESYTAILHRQYGNLVHAVQTQNAYGEGGPNEMQPHIGLSNSRGFFGRQGDGISLGSDETPINYRNAGCNNPSRFITKYVISEIHRLFGQSKIHMTHEWSGTAGFTADEYPVIGLLDGKRQYIIGGMCGSGTAVSFNGARHVVQQILDLEGPDDYPCAYFAPTRILDPKNHPWPSSD